MKIKKYMLGMMLGVGLLSACTQTPKETIEETETTVVETETSTEESQEASFEELVALLGQEDEATADLFDGGEENWSADGKFFIGRIYQTTLEGEAVKVFTSCDEEKKVNAVSIWINEGEEPLREGEPEEWIQHISAFAGSQPKQSETYSEVGSVNWDWKMDGYFITLYHLGNNLTISINPAVGELK